MIDVSLLHSAAFTCQCASSHIRGCDMTPIVCIQQKEIKALVNSL